VFLGLRPAPSIQAPIPTGRLYCEALLCDETKHGTSQPASLSQV
jgi:hypothetical protein